MQKRTFTKWTSLLLISTLLLVLIPPSTGVAAGENITITNLYQAVAPLTSAGLPVASEDPNIERVTISPITITANVTGIGASSIPNIYYEVTNMNSRIISSDTTNKAVSDGGFGITFLNVVLTEGLNKIVLKLTGSTTITSEPRWVYYTPVTSIRNYEINSEEWNEVLIYPTTPDSSTIVNITGDAPNSSFVQAQLLGDSGPTTLYSNPETGEFVVTGDKVGSTTNTNFKFIPGDNYITFTAVNSSRTFTEEMKLIYDNNTPFAFDAILADEILAKSPTVDSDADELPLTAGINVTLTASLKVDVDTLGALEHTDVRVTFNGAEVSDTTVSSYALNASRSVAGKYNIYDYTEVVDIGTDLNQIVVFEFYNTLTDSMSSSFSFTYMDSNLPYVEQVQRQTGGIAGSALTKLSTNEINEVPATFYVTANALTDQIEVFIGSSATAADTITDFTLVDGERIFVIEDLLIANGITTMEVVPYIDTDPDIAIETYVENDNGTKTYSISVSNTPYLIVNQAYNGMVIDSTTDLTCTGGTTPCMSGQMINIPLTDEDENMGDSVGDAKIEFYINDLLQATNLVTRVDETNAFFVNITAALINEGVNVLSFVIYIKENGSFVRMTGVDYEIFKFEFESPQFMFINPVEADPTNIKYIQTENLDDTYTTHETTVSFQGKFDEATEITLNVTRTDVDGEEEELIDGYVDGFDPGDRLAVNDDLFDSIDDSSGLFVTGPIELSLTGDTTFEFIISNATNIDVVKTITVTREALPYEVIEPQLGLNSSGEWQANINSNYYQVIIEAESATSVEFDGDVVVGFNVEDENGFEVTRYYYDAKNLKKGKNSIEFEVFSGDESTEGEFILFNTNTVIEGAKYKILMKNKMTAFNKLVELKFPKDTSIVRNDPDAVNSIITAEREILFGIAHQEDGRVDKYLHPASYDGQTGNPNTLITSAARFLLTEPTGRFRPASKLIWIDAGLIEENEDLDNVNTGGGQLPFDSVQYYNRNYDNLAIPSNRGELTLGYSSSIRNDAGKYLTVYHYDYYEDHTGIRAWRWRNVGGIVNTSDNTITVPFERFGYYQVMFMDQSFDDITAHAWARNNLDTLYSKGYMVAKQAPTLFMPSDTISRGEFATLLVKIFDIQLTYSEEATFTDVLRVNPFNNGLYDYKYIETAAFAGIVRGMSGGRFQPDSAIKRQDAAIMIAKAANLKLASESVEAKTLATLQKSFTDATSISLYARTAVEAVVKAGIISGKENTLLTGQSKASYRFDPNLSITRAEASSIAINVLKQQKKLPK